MAEDSGSGGKKARSGRKHESKSPKDFYDIQGETVTRKRKSCPRCGDGIWMAKHKDRQYCGKCGYTVFEGKKSEAEEKPEEGASESGEKAPD